jgi:hypothetical protein
MKAVSFFYPKESFAVAYAPQLLNGLLTRCREVIFANMRQAVSLTLKILKFLYPRANLDVVSEGFAATCNDVDALKLMDDSAMTIDHILDMVPVDMY